MRRQARSRARIAKSCAELTASNTRRVSESRPRTRATGTRGQRATYHFALLEEAEQRRRHRLAVRGGHLVHLAVANNKAALNLLELKVPVDLCVNQQLDQVAIRHDQLGDQVNKIVARRAKLFRRSCTSAETIEQLNDAQQGRTKSA